MWKGVVEAEKLCPSAPHFHGRISDPMHMGDDGHGLIDSRDLRIFPGACSRVVCLDLLYPSIQCIRPKFSPGRRGPSERQGHKRESISNVMAPPAIVGIVSIGEMGTGNAEHSCLPSLDQRFA